jgi:hypothetical protein
MVEAVGFEPTRRYEGYGRPNACRGVSSAQYATLPRFRAQKRPASRKAGGAFCYGQTIVHSYLLVNLDLPIKIVKSLFLIYIPALIWRVHGSGANYDDGVSL